MNQADNLPQEERFEWVRSQFYEDPNIDGAYWRVDRIIHFAFLIHYIRQGY